MSHTIFIFPILKVTVPIWGQMSNYISAITQKSTNTSFIKFYRKTRHHDHYVIHSTLFPILKVKVTGSDRESSSLLQLLIKLSIKVILIKLLIKLISSCKHMSCGRLRFFAQVQVTTRGQTSVQGAFGSI